MSEVLKSAKRVLDIEASALLKAKEQLDSEFEKAVEIIYNLKGKLIVIGVGKSGHIGAKIAATLASTGTSSFFLHPAEAMHGDLGMIGKNDGVLAISYSGRSEELINLIPHIKNFGVPIIGMSRSKTTPLAKMSDAHININVEKEACPLGIAPTASTTLTLAMGDALAVALMEKKAFKKEDFAKFHPAGTLGKRLYLKAKHFLIPKERLPLVDKKIPLKEALVIMSAARLGHVIIVNKNDEIEGIFSDGDLRRAIMQKDFNINKPIEKYMTKNPFMLESCDILAVDALRLIEERKIQMLLFTQNKKLTGAIHIHQLVEAGIEKDETK